ncbi:MAG: tRNA 2-selenouridine(34) synthase MnmH [Candidatus Alkaliphilus sp. MAG34]
MFTKITVEEAISIRDKIFVDTRSPSEFAKGSIPEAINIPILNNEERADVGTIYTNRNPEEAKIKGIEYVSPKLSSIYDQISSLAKKYKNIILFCWRGGLRSSVLSGFLGTLGINIFQLEGGYKKYRKYVIEYFDENRFRHRFIVLHGYTGVGKTEILEQLKTFGIPVLNLECLAKNSGSVFGKIAYQNEKPVTQKTFEALLFETLRLNNNKYMVTESEGRRLGSVSLPKNLWKAIVEGTHILINTDMETRIKRLVNDYVIKISNCNILLENAVTHLKNKIGEKRVNQLILWIENQEYSKVAEELIINYYDPLYKKSVEDYNYVIEINSINIKKAVDKIIKFYYNLENKQI